MNLVFHKLFKAVIRNESGKGPLHTGSCGLHTLHNSFTAGARKSWQIDQFLTSLYFLFHDTPARREDYEAALGEGQSGKYPMKHCNHRWLENQSVVQWAIEILPNIKKFVQVVLGWKKPITTKSFEVISNIIKNPLLEAKLSSFSSIANPYFLLCATT